jgi:hypothetical protein
MDACETVWVVRYWMPPALFLTFHSCYRTKVGAVAGAWGGVLVEMHRDGFVPAVRPASEFFPDATDAAVVVAPVHDDGRPARALALVTEETVR